MRIDCSPLRQDLIATAGSDGSVCIFGGHALSLEHRITCSNEEMMSVKFHPMNENLLGAAGDKGSLNLYDIRSTNTPLLRLKLTGKSKRYGRPFWPSITSIDFSSDGTKMLLSCQSFLPTMLSLKPAIGDTPQLTVFYDSTYRNLSTIKSMVFNRDSSEVFCGSDNKLIYRFAVPSQHKVSEAADIRDPFYSQLSYSQPVMIARGPVEMIAGHQSNANNVLCHQKLPYVYGCGVEKSIVCHSTFSHGKSSSPGEDGQDNGNDGSVNNRRRGVGFLLSMFGDSEVLIMAPEPIDPRDGGDDDSLRQEEDLYTLAMFDVLNSDAEWNQLDNYTPSTASSGESDTASSSAESDNADTMTS